MKNLVICCAGDNSLHYSWIREPDIKNFDLLVVYFGDEPSKWEDTSDYYFKAKGLKWELVSNIFKDNEDLFDKYDYIWVPDDDIYTDTQTINALFNIVSRYQLDLAQPSLHPSSYIALSITRQRPKYFMRYTNIIEIMMPLFSHRAFFELSPTFLESRSMWGMDWVWPAMLNPGFKNNNISIIDFISVLHTKPVNRQGGFYQKMGAIPASEWTTFRLTEKAFKSLL